MFGIARLACKAAEMFPRVDFDPAFKLDCPR